MQVNLDHFFDWVFWVNFLGEQILTGVLGHIFGGTNFNAVSAPFFAGSNFVILKRGS